jgi:hypothetical protein
MWADMVPVTQAYAAAKHEVERLQPNLTPDQKRAAINLRFAEAVQRTQNGTTPMELSALSSTARRSALGSSLLMFTSDANKKGNMLLAADSKKAAGRAAAVVAASALASAAIGYLGSQGARDVGRLITGAPEPDDERQKAMIEAAWAFIQDLGGSFYLGDRIVGMFRAAAMGRPDYALLDTPPERILQEMVKHGIMLSNAIAQKFDADPKKSDVAWHKIARATFYLALDFTTLKGVPLPPLQRLAAKGLEGAQGPEAKKEGSEADGVRPVIRRNVEAGDLEDARRLYEQNRTALPLLERMVASGDPSDAVNLWKAATPADQKRALPRLREKIAGADISADQKRKLFADIQQEPPVELDLVEELTRLRNREKAAKLAGQRLPSPDVQRLARLERANALVRQARGRAAEGKLSEAEAERRVKGFVRQAERTRAVVAER